MPLNVLIVDDEPQVREMLARQLTPNGYAVAAVGSGEEALATAWAAVPDLIVLDLNLPGMNGWEILRRLRERPRTAAIPVVILTGQVEPDDIIRGYAAGATYYVAKPYSLDELLRGLKMSQTEAKRGRV